jgi:hypothetical protein
VVNLLLVSGLDESMVGFSFFGDGISGRVVLYRVLFLSETWQTCGVASLG